MFDMSSNLGKFYREKVVLSADAQNSLREKKKLNIKRLKEGLNQYNDEQNTSYSICEVHTQGSMTMHTVVQNDENEYDIDIAIVFEESKLNGLGPLATRNMVANALRLKTKQFNVEPEVRTSCVRVQYAEGYHIDFAVYKRYKENDNDTNYKYKHAGADWTNRDIKALEEWFNNEISEKGKELRTIIRLSKMFCKSHDVWENMPSGLIQTILCDEQMVSCDRIDDIFYHTMKNIVNRLELNISVDAPVDGGKSLVIRESDITKISNLKKRLHSKLEELNILFDDGCTYKNAVDAWGKFFNHPFWDNLSSKVVNEEFSSVRAKYLVSTEEFIEDYYLVDEIYDVDIDCTVIGDGVRLMPIIDFVNIFKKYVPHNFKVNCEIANTNAPSYDKILWKVRNVGVEAEKRNQIRGQILERGSRITENTLFAGEHYIECFLIKNNVCIAIGYVKVPIGLS